MQRYALEIIKELDKIVPVGKIEVVAPNVAMHTLELKNICVKHIGKTHGHVWEQTEFACYVIKQHGIAVNLCNTAPLLCPGIVCVHDVKVKAHPEYFSKLFLIWYRILLRNITKRSRAIITVSNFSKDEICRYYKTAPSQIHVIPSAWNHFEEIDFSENVLEKYGLKGKMYFFTLSSLEPNKNFRWIAETAKSNPQWVFAVAGSISEKVFADGLEFECPPNMRLLGYVSDSEAKTLMRDCKAFLFPTFYEGFGLPPMEAMSVGASVIISETSCMKSIYGEAAHYIDPYNPEVDLDQVLAESVKNADDILEKYSWKKSAGKLWELLQC